MSFISSNNLSSDYTIFDDFINLSGDTRWGVSFAGTTANITSYSESGRPGIARFLLPPTTGVNNIGKGNDALTFGQGNIELHSSIRYPFSGVSGTNMYVVAVGFMDTVISSTPVNNGAYFEYNLTGGFGNNIVAKTCLNSNSTTTVVAPLDTGAWYLTSIIGAPDGNTVDFYLNRRLVARHVTNIPKTGASFGIKAGIYKAIGSTGDAVLDIDFSLFSIKLNQPSFLL